MYATWNSTQDGDATVSDRTDPTAASPKRRRMSASHNGRRTTKATRACDSCKAKKARCSGAKPCTKCRERCIECTYDSRYLRGRPPTPPSSVLPPSVDCVTSSVLSPNAHCATSSVLSLNADCATSSVLPPNAHCATSSPRDEDGLHPSPSRSSPESDTPDINGQYVDRTSGLSFLERARARLQHGHAQQTAQQGSRQPLTVAGDKPLLDSTLDGSPTSPAVLPPIPDAARASALLDLYFDVCVATYKPLHRPMVNAWYRSVADNLARGTPMTHGLGNAKVAVLLSVFAVATYHDQKTRGIVDDVASLSTSDSFFRCSSALTETETGIPHLESAQARLLQVFYLLATCRMNSAWYIFGNLIQIVSALGMHRRSRRRISDSSSTQDFIYSQCRIRAFWSTYILDRYMGVVLGRPRHFHDKDIDQDYPARVDDDQPFASAILGETAGSTECHLDGFIWNVKLAQLVDEISDSLYAIKPSSETTRIDSARTLSAKLDDWYASLPALLKARPSSLFRGFRRQCVAIKLAHQHAVLHLYRPFLLGATSNLNSQADVSTSDFRQESIRRCVQAATQVMRTVDDLAQEGSQFHAFWWTHYVAFCALTVIYVCLQRDMELVGNELEALMSLAGSCQNHLSRATATNAPSRRYSIILEELQSQVHSKRKPQATRARDGAGHSQAHPVSLTDASCTADHVAQIAAPATVPDPFLDWQTSDWLELDASAYGVIPGLSPDFQWLNSTRGFS